MTPKSLIWFYKPFRVLYFIMFVGWNHLGYGIAVQCCSLFGVWLRILILFRIFFWTAFNAQFIALTFNVELQLKWMFLWMWVRVCVTLLLFPVTGSNLLESFIPGRFFSLYSIKSSDKGLALPTTTMPTTMHKKFMNNKYSVSVFESHVSGFVGWEQYTAPSK